MYTAHAPQAALRWGMTLLTMQGKGHTDGIVACVSAALSNLTSHAAPAPPRAVTEPEQPVPYYSGVPPAPPAALLRWEGVLLLSTVALLVTVAGWLLLRLKRCCFHCGAAPCRSGVCGSARSCGAAISPSPSFDGELMPVSPRPPVAPPPPDALQRATDSCRESGSDGAHLPPSALERAAGLLLRWAGPACAVAVLAVLAPTVLQLLRVLRQDGIVDTELSSFRSVTGRYTDRQDAYWLLLQATTTFGAANGSKATVSRGPCVGVRGEACLAGWARVGVAVGGAPLHGCGGATQCETLVYEMAPCMRHWEAQPSYASLYDAMSACDADGADADAPACVGVQYDGQGRYVLYGGEGTGAQGAVLPPGQVGFLPPGAAQRRALQHDELLPPPQPPPPQPPPPPPPTPPTRRPLLWEWVSPWEWATMWATQRSPLQDVRRRLSGGEIVTTMHVMYTVAGGRDEAGSKVRGDVLAPEVLARVREVEAEIVAFSADHVTRLDSAVPCLLGRKSAAAEAGGALAWYAAEDAGEPSQANVVSCVYGLLAAAEGSDHFGTDLDASMRGGANMTCPALRSSLTFRGAPDQAWARRLIWRLYAISGGGGVEVSFRGDGGWFWAEFEANLTRDVGFVAVSLAFIWLELGLGLGLGLGSGLGLGLGLA